MIDPAIPAELEQEWTAEIIDKMFVYASAENSSIPLHRSVVQGQCKQFLLELISKAYTLGLQQGRAHGWQPIASAPKTGDALFWIPKNEKFPDDSGLIYMGVEGCWPSVLATHWQPLPPPPDPPPTPSETRDTNRHPSGWDEGPRSTGER